MAGSVATLTHRVIVPCRIAGECNAGPVAVERNNLNFKLGITFFIKRGLGAATEDRHRAQSREYGSTKANCGEGVLIDYGCFVQNIGLRDGGSSDAKSDILYRSEVGKQTVFADIWRNVF